MRNPTLIKQAKKDFEQSNRIAARIILADPDKFGGPGSGCVLWAQTFTQRMAREEREHQQEKQRAYQNVRRGGQAA